MNSPSALEQWCAKQLGRQTIRVREVATPPEAAGELFSRTFRQTIPKTPRHFVIEGTLGLRDKPVVLGYVHFEPFHDAYLAGGLVVDAWRFRQLPKHLQVHIRDRGGLAEWLMTDGCAALSPCLAVYAYIGDKKSETVNRRVGFQHTSHNRLLFVLVRDGATRPDLLDERTTAVDKIGPF